MKNTILCFALLTILTILFWFAFSANLHDPFQKGFVLSLFGENSSYDFTYALRDIAELGADTVSLMVMNCQENENSAVIFRHPDLTPSDEQVRFLIRESRNLGLRVLLMPTLYLLEPGENAWRGTIRPKDLNAWMDSYRRLFLHFARLAQEEHVNYLCIGSELSSMEEHTHFWIDLIHRIKAKFSGRLLYSANWDHPEGVGFWNELDFMGINGYFDLNPKKLPAPDLSSILEVWRWNIRKMSDRRKTTGIPIIITEVGYRSVKGCLEEPWNYMLEGEAALEEQALCYRAFIQAWRRTDFIHGVYFYNWSGPGGPDDTDYTPRGKPAEDLVHQWFKSRNGIGKIFFGS